jgi:hypothetical protein
MEQEEMTSQISCSYEIIATGAVQVATLQAEVAAVAIPIVQLAEFGLRVLSDNTSALGPTITRTIVLGMNPSSNAAATTSLVPGDETGSPIQSASVSAGGSGYVQPPIVSFVGGVARPDNFTPATAHAVIESGVVTAVVVDNPGAGYTSPPTIVLTPLFKAMFPDTTDQGAPLAGWMTGVLQAALRLPIITLVPVVS